ncbi:(S)-2-haloacid dehalogenase 4A [Apiospora hydei]|uniref:(S)-2-haloacid dehalogenase 4A n=1 Tax=Apiospora hydei TaxID=1337664 RepID=A0ABR1V4U1_9PEZI
MTSPNKHVVFDVVGKLPFTESLSTKTAANQGFLSAHLLGTLVDYEAFYSALEVPPRPPACAPTPSAPASSATPGWRPARRSRRRRPRAFATDDDRDFLLGAYAQLRTRPGVEQCFRTLRQAGYTVWALTSGDVARVSGYLRDGGVEILPENFVSCDSIGVGKPAPAVYEHVLEQFPAEGLDAWFAAGHMWDASAARRTGEPGCPRGEKEMCSEIFGDMDVVADSLPEMADRIVAFEEQLAGQE